MNVTQLVEKAMNKAQSALATLYRGESTHVSFQNDKLKSVTSAQSTTIGVRVIADGRVGSSNTTDPNDMDGVVARAIETAEFGSPAHFEFPGYQKAEQVKTFDPSVPQITKEDMIRIGREMMTIVKDYNKDIILDAGIRKNIAGRELATSAGAAYTTEGTSFSVHVMGQWIRGTDILMAGDGLSWRKTGIDYHEVARKAVEWFKLAKDTASIKSGDMSVIFTPEGMNVLLLALVMGFNGKNVLLGSSPLAGRLGETIADERLTILDDPLIDYAVGSGMYDADGVPRRVTPLIKNGVAGNFLYDLDTAGRAGVPSTGNGPGCRPANLVVKEGSTPYSQMIADTQNGLIVHNVLGLGQGNVINGDFSVNVQLGYKIEDGRIAGRVKDVMLAGNTYEALKNITAIGDTGEWINSTYAPPVKIAKLSVVAK